jgi:hypothetical protein
VLHADRRRPHLAVRIHHRVSMPVSKFVIQRWPGRMKTREDGQ